MQQENKSANNKRIAKNTLLLYVRMFFLMLISLYTSRVVLNALGVEDYGIYNVVGGFVSLFSVLCGSLSTSISRFLTFELGKSKNSSKLNVVFFSALSIQLLIATIILLIGETAGTWFINTRLVIPVERLHAAQYVFQFSLLTFCIQLFIVPYNAAIIAHEKMQAFAYISIIEALGKLLVAYSLVHSQDDRLVLFAILIATVQCVTSMIYVGYCYKNFVECRLHICIDKKLLRQMFGFAGWTFIGSSAIHLRDQGGNILINMFFGPSVNAAHGLSMKVNTVVQQFVNNFMTALNPQIIKNYACGDYSYMYNLIYIGSRASFYLLLLITLPILISTKTILHLWLGVVPEYTAEFVKLLMILAMSDALSNPIITAQSATGKIRNYQLVVGGTLLLNLPIVYCLFRMELGPENSIIVSILLSQVCLFLRLYMFKRNVNSFHIKAFFINVYFNVWLVSIVASILPIILSYYLNQSITTFIVLTFICLITTVISIFYVGCSRWERKLIIEKINNFVVKKK